MRRDLTGVESLTGVDVLVGRELERPEFEIWGGAKVGKGESTGTSTSIYYAI